jgi:tetratricopeptide (TPR) repeat protein
MILSDDPGVAPANAPPEHELRRPVIVLYVEPDVDDQSDPNAVRSTAASALAIVRAAVDAHGGAVHQLLGDEAIAFFGLPIAHEDDGLRALRAAAEVQESLGAAATPARVALVSGDVVGGGGDRPLAGPIVGKARDLGARAAPGTILISRSALRLVGGAVETVPADGTGEAFRVLELLPGVARSFESPLVGRGAELGRVRGVLAEAVDTRSCRLLVVAGEPGIGKSRLAREFQAAIGAHAEVLTGSCVAYGEAATYRPLADVLRQALGRGDARRRIRTVLRDQPDADIVAGELAPLLETGAPSAPGTNVFSDLRRMLEALAARRPLVITIEDLHWAEPPLLDFVEYMAGWSVGTPILLLGLTRPELLDSRPEWRRHELVLEPLSEPDARRLAEASNDRLGLDEATLTEVIETGEGNPLFLEQLLAFAAEGEHGLPPSLEQLLVSRLDLLDPDERDVLGHAAVAGRECWRGAIEALAAPHAREEVGGRTISLVRRRLLRPSASSLPGEDAFVFHHVLIRDAAYASVPTRTRAELHERLARWLDDRPDAADEVIGFHLEQAHRYAAELGESRAALAREAGERLGRAGIAAAKRSDLGVTVDLLSRSIALLPERDPSRLGLACELAIGLKRTGDVARVEALLDETLAAAVEGGLRTTELRARIERIWPRLMRGEDDPEDGMRLVAEALPELEADGDARALERAWLCVAAVRGRLQCRHAESGAAAEQGLVNSRRSGFPQGPYLAMLAADACDGPAHVDEAVARCVELLAEAGADRDADTHVRLHLARLEAMRGDFVVAQRQLDRVRAFFEEFARMVLTRDFLLALTEVESLAGGGEGLESALRDACIQLERERDTAWLATQTAALAEVVYQAGRHEEALELSQKAMAAAHPGDVPAQVAWRRIRAKALARQGIADEGEALAREALAVLEPTDELNERASTLLALAEVLDLDGRKAESEGALAAAEELLERKGNTALLRRIHA